MNRSAGLVALVVLSIAALIAVAGVTPPVGVAPGPAILEPVAATRPPGDAGSLDAILDAVHVEHVIKLGR